MFWTFDIIRDFDLGLEAAAMAFTDAPRRHVFQHPAILRAWCDTYRPLRRLEPAFIVATSADGLKAVYPLCVWHRNWKNAFICRIIPVGFSDFDYLDPIFSAIPGEADLLSFWTDLKVFISHALRFDEATLEGVTDALLPASHCNWRPGELCPMLRLDGISDEAALMKFFRTSLRGDIRRQMRRLLETGDVTMAEYNCFDDISPKTFASFMRHHSMRWPKAYKAPHFHENLLRAGLKPGCVHFSVLRAGPAEVAWHLGFELDGRYYYYMPAANQDYLRYSPVKIHLFHLVRRAIESGLDVFDHLRGEENYKDGWSNDSQHVNSLDFVSTDTLARVKHNLMRLRGITP